MRPVIRAVIKIMVVADPYTGADTEKRRPAATLPQCHKADAILTRPSTRYITKTSLYTLISSQIAMAKAVVGP